MFCKSQSILDHWSMQGTPSLYSTSHCKTNKYFIKVPLIIDGGHLAAVLCSVWSGGVEDQDVGRLSELSSVLQVPFWEREKRKKTLYNCSFTYTVWLHSWEKQDSMPSSFKVLFIQLSFEGWHIALKCCGLTGWGGFQTESVLPDILFWKYT